MIEAVALKAITHLTIGNKILMLRVAINLQLMKSELAKVNGVLRIRSIEATLSFKTHSCLKVIHIFLG